MPATAVFVEVEVKSNLKYRVSLLTLSKRAFLGDDILVMSLSV